MKAKFKKFIESIGLTKAQLITVFLSYFLCFTLFLGVVVIWDPMSKSTNENTTVVEAALMPSDTSGSWITEGRYSIDWYTKAQNVVINGTTYQPGTERNPYIIDSAEDLAGLSYLVYTKGQTGSPLKSSDYSGNYIFQGKSFRQTVNIDLSAYYWQPIGISYARSGNTITNYFSGSYDGGNHAVSGIFTLSGAGDEYPHYGLFGCVRSLNSSYPITIQNLGIKNSLIMGYQFTGGVVGSIQSATITNCYNTSSILGNSIAGGVVGIASGTTTISNCYNTGPIFTDSGMVGGVVGYVPASAAVRITNCYNVGSVSGASNSSIHVGGIAGYVYSTDTTITNCYNTGAVSGYSGVGGVVGTSNGAVTNCYYGGGVTGTLGSYGTYRSDITSRAKTPSWYTSTSNWDSEYPWDFENVWVLDASVNDGYPILDSYWIREGCYSIEWFTNAEDGVGSSAENPYIIDSAEDLAGLSWLVCTKGQSGNPLVEGVDYSGNYIFQGKYFKQTVNIDLSAYYWQPIGTWYTRDGTSRDNFFSGSYDGGNHTVSGIFTPAGTTNAYSSQGLFGYVYSISTYPITIKNIGISNSFIQGNGVGGVVGYAGSSGTITITNCYNTGSIGGSSYVGGVVGHAYTSPFGATITITNCYNTGAVSGSSNYVGGVVGYAGTYATITNCYNTGSVNGSGNFVGGVVSSSSSISNCYNTGSVNGSGNFVGGVVGAASNKITNCYNMGDVTSTATGDLYVGGVVGYAGTYATITNCYNTGDVSGSSYVGGVVGYASASSTTGCNISKSANFGDITVTGSSGSVGRIVGYVRVTNSSYSFKMTNCYSEGSITVSGTNVTVGGFVGKLYADYSTYSNVKIEFCSVDLDIVVGGGSIASQGVFYGGTNGLTVENSYSLLTKSGTVSKVISDVSTQMDNNFGYMLNFKEGKPIPLGIFHILDVATRTGIVNRINAL